MRYVILLGFAVLFIVACKKRTIVVPKACIKVDKTKVFLNDTVRVANCSTGANSVSLFIVPEANLYDKTRYGSSFSRSSELDIIVQDTGNIYLIVQATGEAGAPISNDTAIVHSSKK